MRKEYTWFLIPYLLVLIGGFTLYLFQGHGGSVLWLNEHHTPVADQFFKYLTYLGDGIGLVVLTVILLVFKRRWGLVMIVIGVSQAIVSWTLKRIVFGKVPRPKKFFDDSVTLNFVEGVDVHGWYSFPSGHTITIFSMAVFASLLIKKPIWCFLLLIVAVFTAMSRMYLHQHFLIDVLVGSMIGTVISLLCHHLFRNYLEPAKG